MARGALSCLLLAVTLGLVSACESEEAVSIRRGEDADGARLEIAFYDKVSRKSGRRGDPTDAFTMDEKAYVYAFADFTGLRTGRDYTVHLVWIAPSGGEIFRKFAEFRLAGEPGAYVTTLHWKDATELQKVRTEELTSEEPAVSLDSTMNVSAERDRAAGAYLFRVYLDRRLVGERGFTLSPPTT